MKVQTILCLFFYFLRNINWALCLCASQPFVDYYWRDYTGKIPEDAVPAGKDINNENIYIGQAYLHKEGIFPTSIYRGDKVVYVPLVGAKKSDNFVQILCSEFSLSDAFKWTNANKTHLHLTTVDDHLIRGGIEDQKWLLIGRVKYQGQVVIGKVLQGHVGNAVMYFAHNGSEHHADSYQVLTFDQSVSVQPRFCDDVVNT